jgi:hypothetical protein
MQPDDSDGSPVIIRLSAVTGKKELEWLRLAGLEVPLLLEHAEVVIQETKQVWDSRPATARQERFLCLRGRSSDGLSQRQAFDLIAEAAVRELEEIRIQGAPSWQRLVELEPRLAELVGEAAREFAANDLVSWEEAWFGKEGLRARMCRLVGYGAEQPGLLSTMAAFERAYNQIVRARLPAG